MAWPHRNLKQTITYWAPGAPDGYGGLAFATPVQIKGRWEDRVEIYADPSGRELSCNAVVYLADSVVNRGYLYNGESSAASPLSVSGAKEIRRFDRTPTLNASYFENKAYL